MKKLYHSCMIAFSMFSKIPVPNCDWSEENMAYMMCFFPWVGVAVGGLTGLWGILGRNLSWNGCLYTVILMLIPFWVTGGIHLDGLLDTADALSSWMPRERRLEILKDVHTGAFAVLTGIVYFALMYGAYSEVTPDILPFLCLSFPMTRCLSAMSIVSFPKARRDGTVAAFSKDASTRRVQAVLILYMLLLTAVNLYLHPVYGAVNCGAAAAVFVWYYRKAMKYFGGTTGDIAGYFLSICELVMLLAQVFVHVIERGRVL